MKTWLEERRRRKDELCSFEAGQKVRGDRRDGGAVAKDERNAKLMHNAGTKNHSKQLSEVTDLVQLNFHRKNGTALLKLIDLYLLDCAKKLDEAMRDGDAPTLCK